MANESLVLVLPGWLGTHLAWQHVPGTRASARRVWLDYGRIFIGQLTVLDIERDPPTLIVTDGVHDSLDPLVARIRQDVPPGWRVEAWPWDWRRSLLESGAFLGAEIATRAQEWEGGVRVVAHSAGGLVARAAWVWLVNQGIEHRLPRVVTLGTPHRGSYAPVQIWIEQDSTFNLLVHLEAFPLQFPHPIASLLWEAKAVEIHGLFARFPSVYQLLPWRYAEDRIIDPLVDVIYDADTWLPSLGGRLGPRGISPAHLDSQSNWQVTLSHPDVQPPPGVFVTVAGHGTPTPFRLRRPLPNPPAWVRISHQLSPAFRRHIRLSLLPSLDTTEAGDGRVTTRSALLAGAAQVILESDHGGLLVHPIVLDRVVPWLLDHDPAPGPVVVDAPAHPLRGAPLPAAHVLRGLCGRAI